MMLSLFVRRKRELGFAVLIIGLLFFATGCVRLTKQKPGEEADLSGPRQSVVSYPLERLNRGFGNMVFGPLEIVNRLREEVNRTDPVNGFLPGLVKGVLWFGLREVVGAFEVVTFVLPLKPILPEFNTDWLHA